MLICVIGEGPDLELALLEVIIAGGVAGAAKGQHRSAFECDPARRLLHALLRHNLRGPFLIKKNRTPPQKIRTPALNRKLRRPLLWVFPNNQ